MTDSLRDQLLHLGFKAAPAPERKPGGNKGGGAPDARAKGAHGRPAQGRPAHGKGKGHPGGKGEGAGRGPRAPGPSPAPSAQMDLGKAFALRAQQEKRERIEAEQRKQEEARQRREARAKLEPLLQDRALNDPAAEIARHFEYGGKIKRIYVTEVQLKALNAGALGVVQLNGRYLLVEAAVLAEVESVFPAAVALRVDPDAPAADDPYADPRYQVPDDLVW
ncbi:DUF2058 domain-containing protein [Pseudoxanthomonas suwonensis]|uniref:Nucleoprotein/polynucleotide-associated enzyme n=1 Tax=Pseudoxanthomonas suwonensis TaxID=314722 RepID=A0A0E3UPG1_9GAMM|nr:DUF2058 family protein [Pseudoxanthomonas suwonensis]AKC87800.1 nucleoprotein/polynucleotide-associated enzyme [Pseudoxanthomonas suwonensis]